MDLWMFELVLEYRGAEWHGSNAELQTVSFGSDVSLHTAISAQARKSQSHRPAFVGLLGDWNALAPPPSFP